MKTVHIVGDAPHGKTMKTLLAVAALVALFGVVGTMDYQDELEEAEHYAAMVCDETWPNYKEIEVDCNGH